MSFLEVFLGVENKGGLVDLLKWKEQYECFFSAYFYESEPHHNFWSFVQTILVFRLDTRHTNHDL